MSDSLLKDFKKAFKTQEPDKYEAARFSFWEYLKLINPKFFKDDRPHLVTIANTLQALAEGRIRKFTHESPWQIYSKEPDEQGRCVMESVSGSIADSSTGSAKRNFRREEIDEYFSDGGSFIVCKQLMLNIPPRHGKSYILTLFTQWLFGKNKDNRVITVSYNETLASRFSANVRDGIDATKIDRNLVIFSDVFPSTRIKEGDGAKQLWALEGSYFSYLGTGFGGTITGIGCNIGIIDDPVKNAEEAFNDNALEKQWMWYTDTFLSRIEEGGIQIINMTRWSTKDLCGRILDSEEAAEWYVINMKACPDETSGTMLCPALLSFKTYMKKKRLTSAEIHEANYQQEPVDVQGKLYTMLKTYTELPKDDKGRPLYDRVINYTDTADTGKDFLCSINAIEYNGEAYIINVLYTDKPMAVTEPLAAKMLHDDNVNTAHIESNNGGGGFARNVERLIWEQYKTRKIVVRSFHQSQNKQARILSNSSYVMEHVYFPVNWNNRWPDFYKAIMTYKAKGGNKHDDAPDGLTGIAENIGAGAAIEFLR